MLTVTRKLGEPLVLNVGTEIQITVTSVENEVAKIEIAVPHAISEYEKQICRKILLHMTGETKIFFRKRHKGRKTGELQVI